MGIVSGGADQQAILISKQQAAESAEARRKAVAQRAYREPAVSSNELKACSNYAEQ
jgi:hypothetical protein